MVGLPETYMQRGFQGFIGVPLILADRLKNVQGKGLSDRSSRCHQWRESLMRAIGYNGAIIVF